MVAATSGTFYGQAIAGDGTPGFSGDDGPAADAEICGRTANGSYATSDPHGNIIFSDGCNQRVRVVAGATGTFYGVSMTAGDIYTLGASATVSTARGYPTAVVVDAQGNLIISDPDVVLATPDGVAPVDLDLWDDRVATTPSAIGWSAGGGGC